MRICEECGFEIEEDFLNFCPSCGAAVTRDVKTKNISVAHSQSPKNEDKNKKKLFYIIGNLVIATVIVFLVVLLLRGCGNDKNGVTESGAVFENSASDKLIIDESENSDGFESPESTNVSGFVTSATSATTPRETAKSTESVKVTNKPTATPTKAATAKPTPTKAATAKPTATKASIPTPTATSSVKAPSTSPKVGDVVKYGKYEQDNNTSNGKEDIEWIVLAKENNRILVVSKYALDYKQYNTSYTDITWEDCTLRSWLNSNFINNAFSSTEKSKIPTVTVKAEAHPSYGTEAGNNTQDKVFLLSISEVNKYFSSDSARMCTATAYAAAQVEYMYDDFSWWWLRSPGFSQSCVAYVDYKGCVYATGDVISIGFNVDDCWAVRPSMWIELDS